MNVCGECGACCHTHGCEELGQRPFADCSRLTLLPVAGRCSAYDGRPRGCRHFNCAWLVGAFGGRPEWRPDRCGLVVAGVEGGWTLSEYRPGSADDPANAGLLAAVARMGGEILVVRPGGVGTLVGRGRLGDYAACSLSFDVGAT